ncbi:MAG: Gfo/Idh/MocA family oxidoreductase [Planctomycetes bacterium]|nr:Gfo/Idh/MocA family oxidoreductase [Planctomycetota bacterium]
MAKSTLRVAVIGAGRWGGEHARAFSERQDVELCALVDIDPRAAERRAREFRARPYVDLHDMLRAEKPDFASVAVSNMAQFSPTLELIRAGVPLLVEKPLAFSLDDADVLLDEAARRALFFAIDFNHRYARPVMLAREAIRSGRLGDLVFATWRFGGEHSATEHPHANLIETQCHGLDMLEYLCGPIESVAAEMTEMTGRGLTTIVLSLKFASGAVGSLVGSYDSSYQYSNVHLLEVNGTDGHVLVEDTVRRFTYQRKGSEHREVWEAGYFNDVDRAFRRILDSHLDAVLAAFRRDEEPPVHASAGRRALALAFAAIQAYESGRRTMIPPEPHPSTKSAA